MHSFGLPFLKSDFTRAVFKQSGEVEVKMARMVRYAITGISQYLFSFSAIIWTLSGPVAFLVGKLSITDETLTVSIDSKLKIGTKCKSIPLMVFSFDGCFSVQNFIYEPPFFILVCFTV